MTAVRLGVVSDVHLVFDGSNRIGSRVSEPEGWDFAGTRERLQLAIERLEQEDFDGLVVLGDVAHHGDDETLDRAMVDLGRLPGGLWVAPGNHDVARRADAVSRALGRAGRQPQPCLDNGQRLSVLEIESVDWIASCKARFAPPVDLWRDELVLLATHFPLLAPADRDPRPGDHLVDNAALLERLVARSGPTVVLSGHFHARAVGSTGPVLQLIFPALVEVPAHCSILELGVTSGRHRVTRTHLPLRDGFGPPEVETWEFADGRWLQLQLADLSPSDEL